MIYDCFIFFNELDLLELRLNELDDVVDKFVIVEATTTFTGKKKPLLFKENQKRFSKFIKKINYVVVDDLDKAPPLSTLPYIDKNIYEINEDVWLKEIYQRNCIKKGLNNCKSDDLVIISDVDEIPNKKCIYKIDKLDGISAFKQKLYYYYFNCISTESWFGSRIVKYSNLTDPQEIRDEKKINIINDGGWHFSYLGGYKKIIEKISSFSHQELNTKEFVDLERIRFNIENYLDIFGRPLEFKLVEIDNTLPEYLRKNKVKFKDYIKAPSAIDANTLNLRKEIIRLRKQLNMMKNNLEEIKK